MAAPLAATAPRASEMALEPTKYCYQCGKPHTGAEHCAACGGATNPSEDTYFTGETCHSCDRHIPRWSRFCPYCGTQQKKNDDAGYPAQWKKYKRNLIITDLIWTAVLFVAAKVLSDKMARLSFTTGLILAAGFAVVLWTTAVIGMRKGRFWDGTVIGFSTQPGTQKVCVDAGKFEEVPCTIYETQIQWDNGKTLTRSLKANRADHEQLKVGDRVRLYDGIERFAKL